MSPSNYRCIFNKIILDLNSVISQPALNRVFMKDLLWRCRRITLTRNGSRFTKWRSWDWSVKLTGRIEDARIEMAARLVKLRDAPGLHAQEISAIDKAHRILRLLESEEDRLAAKQKRRPIEEALRQVRSIAPKIEKLTGS